MLGSYQTLKKRFLGLLGLASIVTSLGCQPSTPPVSPSPAHTGPTIAKEVGNAELQPVEAELKAVEKEASADSASTPLDQVDATTASIQNDQRFAPEAEWTRRRLIALAPEGPLTVEIAVRVGDKSLEQSSAETAMVVIAELMEQVETPNWDAILELPIVASGWLGNLVAADTERESLITMYDTNSDGIADADELLPFLTRGLSRKSPLQLTNGGREGGGIGTSPWGPADADNDNALNLSTEFDGIEERLMQQDINSDATLTRQEAQTPGAGSPMRTQSAREFLGADAMFVVESVEPVAKMGAEASDNNSGDPSLRRDAVEKQLRRHAREFIKRFTLLDTIPREQFRHWSDEHWQRWDLDHDLALQTGEMIEWMHGPADVTLYVTLPPLPTGMPTTTGTEMKGMSAATADIMTTVATSTMIHCLTSELAGGSFVANDRAGGKLAAGVCQVRIDVADELPISGVDRLKGTFQQALNNPQLMGLVRSQLQLSDDGFQLVDGDGNGQLSDAEFARALRWLSVRQEARLIVTWRAVELAWFELGDENGDGRMTVAEIRELKSRLNQLDRDGDGAITPYEIPLLASLELRRSDSRLGGFGNGPEAATPANEPTDWFAAMDTNADGMLSFSEFLGSQEQFDDRDLNKDGFMSRREVYVSP